MHMPLSSLQLPYVHPPFPVAGLCEEDGDPSDAPSPGKSTPSFPGRPSSGAEFSGVSVRWGEDSSDEGSVGDTPAQFPRFGATDHEDVEIGAVSNRPVPPFCGSDGSDDDNGVSVPIPSTRWGDESDDDKFESDARLDTSSSPPGILETAVGVDEHTAEEKRSQDERELLGGPHDEEEEHATASWGSDDGEDDFRPSDFSQPFRMGAAAGVPSVSVSSALLPTFAAHASASWGRDGEEGEDDSGNGHPFSLTIPTQTDMNAQPLSPVRHHHRRDDSDEIVVAPWMPHAQGRSGLVDEVDHSWADESGDGGDSSPRRTENLNRILMGGVHIPARNATLPGFDDVEIESDGETSPRDGHLAVRHPGQTSTPSTSASSPWFSALRQYFTQKSLTADRGGRNENDRYPWNSQPATTPLHGDPQPNHWSRPHATVPPRSGIPATAESSPMHEVLTQGDSDKHKSPALTPVRKCRSWFRRKAKEVGPPRARGDKGEEKGDGSSGVRAWGWRDTLQRAPGLVGRLGVCILAVCALWATSLSVVGDNDLKSTYEDVF